MGKVLVVDFHVVEILFEKREAVTRRFYVKKPFWKNFTKFMGEKTCDGVIFKVKLQVCEISDIFHHGWSLVYLLLAASLYKRDIG